MNRFATRSKDTELIDQSGIPFTDWEICLKELDVVNTWLGGHAITVEGVQRLLHKKPADPMRIVEIGCGGGDNLRAIHRNNPALSHEYIGIDINEACVVYARENCKTLSSAKFICSDYRAVDFKGEKPDIIFNSLFCHHFSDSQLVEMLLWMKNNSRIGFFINDLQRHPLAFHSIKLLTRLFSKSYLVINDAPISVSRGFTKREWNELMKQAGINNFQIQWKWAFRFLVLYQHAQH